MVESCRILGYENFLINMVLQPELIHTIVDKVTDVYLKLNDTFFSELKGEIDIWFFESDFGSQNGLLFGPEMLYKFFCNNINNLVELAHGCSFKSMIHSCGGISEIIPYLIEAGVIILDPIQVTAKGMKLEILVEKYNSKIVFHWGIDTQHLLVNSTSEEIRYNARKTIDLFKNRGGYIFAQSQILNPDITLENIVAICSEACGNDIL